MKTLIDNWIEKLDSDWIEWKFTFYTLPYSNQQYFYDAVKDAGVKTYEQFLEYMSI